MAIVTVNESTLTDIADSIRSKLNVQTTYKPSEMADAIDSISGGGITPTGTIEITQNGVVDVTNYASADVDVPTGSTPVINSLSVTENGTYTAPTGVDGYSPVTVNVPQGSTPTGTKQISITQNGTTTEDVTNYASAEITVNVSGGGGTTSTTGEFTLASDFALSATPEKLGLQLPFKPDVFWIGMVNSSWDNISTPSAGIYSIFHLKKIYSPPFRIASNVSTDSLSEDYYTMITSNVTTSTDVSSNGYALNGVSLVGQSYQERFYFDNDGYFYVGRYSTSSTTIRAGTYRYFAIKV